MYCQKSNVICINKCICKVSTNIWILFLSSYDENTTQGETQHNAVLAMNTFCELMHVKQEQCKTVAKSCDSLTHSYFPIRWTTHSCWHRGHRLFCLTHNDIQQLWNEWLHSPQTTTHSSCLFSAWHLKQASITCTLQIAQVSHSTSQLHIATAFHFFNVNIFSPFLLADLSMSIWLSSLSSILTTESVFMQDVNC